MKKLLLTCLVLTILSTGHGQTRGNYGKSSLVAEIGIWKPSSLDDQPSKPFANVRGGQALLGLAFITPNLNSLALKTTYWQWSQETSYDDSDLEQVWLRALSLDIKHLLVTQARICPYALYGIAAIWGRERRKDQAADSMHHVGYAINFGAGVDFLLVRHWGLSAEYQFHYARLQKIIGLTDNYNGPAVSFKLLYFF